MNLTTMPLEDLGYKRHRVEGYELGDILGSGAFSTAYRAVRTTTRAEVVVKIFADANAIISRQRV